MKLTSIDELIRELADAVIDLNREEQTFKCVHKSGCTFDVIVIKKKSLEDQVIFESGTLSSSLPAGNPCLTPCFYMRKR